MTDTTYFARIGNDAEREVARSINSSFYREGDEYIASDGDKIRTVNTTCSCSECSEFIIPFPDFIRRFVPLSVIGSLAKCHGCSVITNGSMKMIDKALEEAGYIKVDEVNDDNT